MVKKSLLVPILLLSLLSQAFGATGPRRSSRSRHSIPSSRRPQRHPSHGKTHRSREAKDAFKRQTGFPHGRPGYVIDHIVPLACGGADDPSNMQWQTVAEGKAKDRWERKGCE